MRKIGNGNDKSDADQIRDQVFQLYKEANLLFRQGDFAEAVAKFNEVVSSGGNWPYDDMVLRTVNAALTQKKKCQFRVLKF